MHVHLYILVWDNLETTLVKLIRRQQQQLHQLHQVNTASLPTPPPNEHSPLGGLVGNHSFGAGLMLGQTATPQLHHLHSIGGLIAGTQSY